jgi:hypothetical protein
MLNNMSPCSKLSTLTVCTVEGDSAVKQGCASSKPRFDINKETFSLIEFDFVYTIFVTLFITCGYLMMAT